MRVVLDTNVIVAGLAYPSGPPGRIVAAWRRGALQVVLSPWILSECERVLPRLRPCVSLSPGEIRELLDCLSFEADLIEPDVAALRQVMPESATSPMSPCWPPCWLPEPTC